MVEPQVFDRSSSGQLRVALQSEFDQYSSKIAGFFGRASSKDQCLALYEALTLLPALSRLKIVPLPGGSAQSITANR